MNCLSCACPDSRVVDSRCAQGKTVWRRRLCESCGAKWSTTEKPDRDTLTTQRVDRPTTMGSSPATQSVGQPPQRQGEISLSLSGSVPGLSGPSKLNNGSHSKMSRTRPTYSDAYLRAFKAYVRPEEKAVAFAVWLAMAKSAGGEEQLCNLVLLALSWQIPTYWVGDNWQYAPYFSRYLKKRKWEDDRPAANGHTRAAPPMYDPEAEDPR